MLQALTSCDVQGVLGSMPRNALIFLTLYMQLLGMTLHRSIVDRPTLCGSP